MKLTLTTDLDCRHRFKKSDGSVYMFPGQDFKAANGPTENEKCREIYVGIMVDDKLECEPGAASESSYSNASSGRSPESPPPPPEESVVIPPELIVCDIRASFGGLDGKHYYLDVKNFGNCNLIFDARCDENSHIIIEPNNDIPLPIGATVTLTLNSDTKENQEGDVIITTNVGCDYTLRVGTVPPEPTPDELDTNL